MAGRRKGRELRPYPLAGRLFFSLRFRLLTLVLLGVVPALVLILYTANEQRRFAAQEGQGSALRMARLVASDYQRLFDETRQLLVTLSYLPETRYGRQETCSQVFAELLRQYPQYANLGVINLDGSLACSGVNPGMRLNLTRYAYVQRALSERAFVAGAYQIDPITGRETIHFSYPVIDEEDQIEAVVFAALDIGWLNQLVNETHLPESGVLLVLDGRGAILVHSPDPEEWVNRRVVQSPLLDTMLAAREGSAELVGLDGVERLYGFTFVPLSAGVGVHIGIGISKEAAFGRVDQVTLRYLAGLSVAVALALAAAWIGGDLFVLRRVQALLNATQRLAAGDLSARTGLPYGQGELSQLARVFDHMSQALEQREIERRQAEEQIKRHMRDLAALNTITATVSSSLELPEVLESLKRLLAEQFNVPGGAIYFYDEDQDVLLLEAAWGLPAAVLAEVKLLPAQSYHYQQVLERREAYLRPDFRMVEPYTATELSYIRPNLGGYLCIPLHAKGQVQGVIDLFSQAPNVFTQDQLDLFLTLGREVGVAVQNARYFEQVDLGRDRLRSLSQQLIEVQENERRHIARELHDEIGQALTAVKVNLQSMQRPAEPDVSAARMEDSLALIDRTIHQVRDLSLDLRPSLLDDLGVVSALRWYIDRQSGRAGFEAHFTANPPEMRLPPELETTCFRVVQEALTNVVRHANARRVDVDLRQETGALWVTITDDGIGFDVAALKERTPVDNTLGLLGMKERVQLVGGELEIASSTEHGTEIRACFPLDLPAAASDTSYTEEPSI